MEDIMMSKQVNFMYRIQPVRPAMLTEGGTPEEDRIVGEHLAYLQHLTETDVVFLAGRTQDSSYSSFGIILFHAKSEDEAQKIVAEDPAVAQRVFRAELYPYRIALLGKAGTHDP
jgi:uncharacterized protein YciI